MAFDCRGSHNNRTGRLLRHGKVKAVRSELRELMRWGMWHYGSGCWCRGYWRHINGSAPFGRRVCGKRGKRPISNRAIAWRPSPKLSGQRISRRRPRRRDRWPVTTPPRRFTGGWGCRYWSHGFVGRVMKVVGSKKGRWMGSSSRVHLRVCPPAEMLTASRRR